MKGLVIKNTLNRKSLLKIIFLFIVFICLILIKDSAFFTPIDNYLFDYFMPETTAHKSILVVNIDEKSLDKYGSWPWDREVYADFIEFASDEGSAVIAFDIYLAEETSKDYLLKDSISNNSSSTQIIWAGKFDNGTLSKPSQNTVDNSVIGYGNVETDFTGKIRFYQYNSEENKSLAYQIVDLYSYSQIKPRNEIEKIRFTSNYKDFNNISFSDYQSYAEKDLFKDKIVIVGITIQDLKQGINDNFIAANTGDYIPGVYVHSNAVNMVLTDSYLNSVPNYLNILLFLIVFIFTIFVGFFVSGPKKIFITLVFPVIIFALLLIYQYGYMFNISFILFSSGIILLLDFLYEYFVNYRENIRVQKAFSQYVGPKLLNKLMDKGEGLLKLGGEEKSLIVMFSDVIGFTSISEKLKPNELIGLLNLYLTKISDIILENDGVIDKYIGDNVMAFWGAPVDVENVAYKSCKTVVEIAKEIEEFNISNDFIKRLNIPIRSGIGLHFGNVVVGNLGSQQKFDYTVIGDNVNLASRIESITRKYCADNLISDLAVKKLDEEGCKEKFVIREVDNIIVKGRTTSIKIYQLLGFANDNDTKRKQDIKNNYEMGLYKYYEGKFEGAIEEFLKNKDDKTSELMIERIKDIEKHIKDGCYKNGVWIWKEK